MNAPPLTALQQAALTKVEEVLQQKSASGDARLNGALRWLAKWRSTVIGNTLRQALGTTVQSGPFQGMKMLDNTTEGTFSARLLGIYEHALHPIVEAAIARNYDTIINIGCADGYYAVGLARRLPNAQIFAYDINPAAQLACRETARLNAVEDRFHIGGEFTHGEFGRFTGKKCLVICDIEGAEGPLLDPSLAPNLSSMDVIVEIHDLVTRVAVRASEWLQRFAATHDIQIIQANQIPAFDIPVPLQGASHFDQLIALWEWRIAPTPWAVLRVKQQDQP